MAQVSAPSRRSASSELSDAPPPNQPVANKGTKSSIFIGETVRPIQIQDMTPSQATVAGPSKHTPQNGTTNGKPTKQTNGSKPKKTGTIVGRSRKLWGRQAQPDCDYDIEGPIQDDWQVAYVWAFLIRFRRDNIPAEAERFDKQNVITELRTVDDFEESLKTEIPNEGLTEVLLVLMKPLWRVAADHLEEKERKDQARRKDAKSRHKPSKALTILREPLIGDTITDKLSHLIDERLKPGWPLSVFDAYIYAKTDFYATEESAVRADAMADQDVNTLGYRQMQEPDQMSDRTQNNPLKSLGFWASPWSIKVKILRQLVDWNLSDADVHDLLTSTRAKGKISTVYDVERWDKGQEQQHWQTVENTWRVYAIKKPLQIHGSTITVAKTKEEYLQLMNRHLAHEAKLPDMRKEKSLAASKNKALELKNKIILAERDVEFGKFLQGRIPAIEANFANFEAQREELARKKARAAERQARDARRFASIPSPADFTRTTRSRGKAAINYAEQNDVDDEEEPSVDYKSRTARTRNGSDGGDYHSSSVEPELPTHGRNTRNSRTSALTAGHGYQTRGTTVSETDGAGSRALSEDAQDEDEDQDRNDTDDNDNGVIAIDEEEDDEDEDVILVNQHKRRYSEVDQEEEDGRTQKRVHLDEDQSSSREGSL